MSRPVGWWVLTRWRGRRPPRSMGRTSPLPSGDFAAASAQVTDRLAAEGFESVSLENTFGGDGYQGINTTWRAPATGQSFDVQFHTPESFAGKTETHLLYEEARPPGTDPARVAELNQQQAAILDAVPIPEGAPHISLPDGAATGERGGVYVPGPVSEYGRTPFQAVGYTGLGVTGVHELREMAR